MAEAYDERCRVQPGKNYVVGQTVGREHWSSDWWKSGKGRELAIAGKSNVLCRNRALVVPMDVQWPAGQESNLFLWWNSALQPRCMCLQRQDLILMIHQLRKCILLQNNEQTTANALLKKPVILLLLFFSLQDTTLFQEKLRFDK